MVTFSLKNKIKKGSGRREASRHSDEVKGVKYVYLVSNKAVFEVVGDPKESQYSYGLPIKPVEGVYRAKGEEYDADELLRLYLDGHRVVLNVNKDSPVIDLVKKGVKVFLIGYDDSEYAVGR